MKAKRLFLANFEEHAQVETLGLKTKPPVRITEIDFYFKIEGVTTAFITTDKHISISLYGMVILLKYEKRVWDKIVTYLD